MGEIFIIQQQKQPNEENGILSKQTMKSTGTHILIQQIPYSSGSYQERKLPFSIHNGWILEVVYKVTSEPMEQIPSAICVQERFNTAETSSLELKKNSLTQ